MTLEIDGAAVLTAIARSPDAFGMTPFNVNALATSVLLANMKGTKVSLPGVRSTFKAIGFQNFAVVIDQMPPKDLASALKKIDPRNTSLKDSDESSKRAHFVKLAEGAVDPATAAPRAPRATSPKTPKETKPKTGEVMKSKALRPKAARKPASKGAG